MRTSSAFGMTVGVLVLSAFAGVAAQEGDDQSAQREFNKAPVAVNATDSSNATPSAPNATTLFINTTTPFVNTTSGTGNGLFASPTVDYWATPTALGANAGSDATVMLSAAPSVAPPVALWAAGAAIAMAWSM